MSESTKEKVSRFVAEAVEARQHTCDHCGHDGSKHAFDVFQVDETQFPCWRSCMVCMEEQTKSLENKK